MTYVLIYIALLSFLFYKFVLEKLPPAIRKKAAIVYSVVISIYAGVTLFLSQGWYTQNSVSFHWFNDSDEWLLMDKVGHFFTSAAWLVLGEVDDSNLIVQ
ncbi:MAG: hypothetical protein HYZ42_05725 [Bacteroidetes bacterium]|nr:hypothetical protein [Bacteroidota bacterium]